MAEQLKQLGFVLFGAILPLIGKGIWLILKWVYRVFFQKDKSVFLGKWFTYHFSTENHVEIFREEKWYIKLKLNGYLASTCDDKRVDLVYKGKLKKASDGSLIFNMRGEGSTEEYYIKVKNPIPNANGSTFGIKVGVDFDSIAFATIYLFSRTKLDDDTAKKQIQEQARKTKSHFLSI